MGKPVVYTWAAASTTAVTQLQTTAGAATLVLNGSLLVSTNPSVISFGAVSRTVSLTSANDLHLVNVTITGTYLGAVQTETRAGPNANTVYTTKLFDTVTSVSVGAAVTALSVGSGTTGSTQWYLYDYYAPNAAFSVQVVVTGTITYSFETTLDDVTTVTSPTVLTGLTVPQPNNAQAFQLVMSAATSSQAGYFNYPTRYVTVAITAATTGSLVATFVQQGIK